MKTVAVVGANGKMGKLLCEKLKPEFCVIKIDIDDDINDFFGLDAVIDFGSAKSSVKSAEYCLKNGVRLLIGATGQNDEELSVIVKASKSVPIMLAKNYSLGIVLLKKALAEILKSGADDITIFEKHHKSKVDSPSGTALDIAQFIKNGFDKNPAILSERGGKEIGTHSVDIYFKDEVISISHQAFSREVFVDGAILAMKYLLKKVEPKLYLFEDVVS